MPAFLIVMCLFATVPPIEAAPLSSRPSLSSSSGILLAVLSVVALVFLVLKFLWKKKKREEEYHEPTERSLAVIKCLLLQDDKEARCKGLMEFVVLAGRSQGDEKKMRCFEGFHMVLSECFANTEPGQTPSDIEMFFKLVVATDFGFLQDIALKVIDEASYSLHYESLSCLTDVATLMLKCMQSPGERRSTSMHAFIDYVEFTPEDRCIKMPTATIVDKIIENAGRSGESETDVEPLECLTSLECLKQLIAHHPSLLQHHAKALTLVCQKISSESEQYVEDAKRKAIAQEIRAIIEG